MNKRNKKPDREGNIRNETIEFKKEISQSIIIIITIDRQALKLAQPLAPAPSSLLLPPALSLLLELELDGECEFQTFQRISGSRPEFRSLIPAT